MAHISLAVSLGCLSLPAALTRCHPHTPALGPTSGFSCGAAPCACCPRAGFAHYTSQKNPKEPCGRIRAAFITKRGGFSHPPQRCGCRRSAPGSAAAPQRERCGALRTTSAPVQPSSAHFKPVQPSPARPSPGAVPGVPPPRSRRRRNPLGGGGRRSRHHEPDGDRVAPGAVPVL